MAHMLTNTRSTGAVASRLGDALASFTRALRQRRSFRRTYTELDALNDRQLADLGLSRGMLRRVAYDAARTI